MPYFCCCLSRWLCCCLSRWFCFCFTRWFCWFIIRTWLNFDQHISNLCRKAGQQLNVLKRLSPFLSRLNKLTIFHTFILSNFNYCPLAWHFCSESSSKKLEKIQERALRFVYDDFKSTYEELLNKANIPYLHIKRIRTMAVETFRILNDMSPPVLSDLVRIRDCSSYNFRYQNVLQVPQVAQQNTVRRVSDLQLPSCGTAFQIILDK